MNSYTKKTFTGTPDEVNKQWQEARTHGIGGSDVASIMGLNPYSSPVEIWLRKTGRGEDADFSGNQAIEWGNRLEPLIAEKFGEEHPEYRVTRPDWMCVSTERPWAFASLDGELEDAQGNKGVLEIKTVGSRRAHDWDAGVPDYYLTQVVHYLSVTGYTFAWVAVLVGGQEYREYYIARDEEDIAAVNKAVDDFWHRCVEQDMMPELIGGFSESQAILAMHEQPEDEYRELDAEDLPKLEELEGINEQIKTLKERKDALENQIKAIIGDDKGVITPTHKITWVRSTRTTFDKKAFDAANPGVTEAYMKTSVTNGGLRISRIGA